MIGWLSSLTVSLLVAAATAAAAGPAPLRVLCSFYPVYVTTLNVTAGVPGVEVRCLAGSVTGCLHDYQLSPADLKAMGRADLLVVNGAGMESFLAKAAEQMPTLKVVEAARGITLAFAGNPHVWLGFDGAIAETRNIASGLAEADPAHAADYRRNASAYEDRLTALRREMHAALDPLPRPPVVTFHEAFPYFAAEFHLTIAAVIEREPGVEPGAGELARIIGIVRQEHVRAIFAEPQYPARSAALIERETGVPVRLLDPVVTGPREPALAREAWIEAMRRNLKTLREVLRDRVS